MKRSGSLPVIGVMGSGSFFFEDQCEQLGCWLASQGVHLLTGGGRGTMECVSRAFFEQEDRKGLVIGIIPGETLPDGWEAKSGYPNQYIELSINTHLPLSGNQGEQVLSRNHINILSSDVLVFLSGGPGTMSEMRLAVNYSKPFIVWEPRQNEIPDLPFGIKKTRDFEEVKAFIRLYI